MNLLESTVRKLNKLPENLLFEVDDFVDFLTKKHKSVSQINSKKYEIDSINPESDMSEYLKNLENYEELLANGKIKW